MPRSSRIDAPGALHHIIIRGIERRKIFRDDSDKKNFLERLEKVLTNTKTPCYAWVLMDNHIHLLLRTGTVPIATVMRRLLTGYAQQFNRRHRRHGHLFQNRYKSILCEEDPYLLELVRYIHLNPIRARMIKDFSKLKSYKYSGHAVLMGKVKNDWQDTDCVLSLFAPTLRKARRAYEEFVAEGLKQKKGADLTGGGLVRSAGGWAALAALRRKGLRMKADERILGSSDFVERVLKKAEEELSERTRLQQQGLTLDSLMKKVAAEYDVSLKGLKSGTKERTAARARTVLCCLAVQKLRLSCAEVARVLGLSPSTVSKAVLRGEKIMREDDMVGKMLPEP